MYGEIVGRDRHATSGHYFQENFMMLAMNRIGPHGRLAALGAVSLAVVAVLGACHNTNTPIGNKGLWIANGTNVLEYIPKQLGTGTSAAVPHLAINSGSFGAPQGVTFDAKGNLWVMDPAGMVNGAATPALFEFSAAQLAALATDNAPDPVATITSTSLAVPQQSVFDAQGNQWVADHDGNAILVFTAAQLAMTGTNNLNPAVVITSTTFNGPLGIAFDSAGDLWVANNGSVTADGTTSAAGTTIVEFTAATLPAPPATGMLTPMLTPEVTLTDDGKNSIQSPWELAFDASGNLWSSNAGGTFSLVEFAKASLAMTGAPMPAVTINSMMVMGNATLSATNGLCIDNAGNVAATSSAAPFGTAYYTKGQLMTGAPTPNTFFVGTATTLNAVAGCNFGPNVN
jgi:sugar lactone lactonase YvrE